MPGTILRVGTLAPIATTDPAVVRDSVTSLFLNQVYETPFGAPANVGEEPFPQLFAEPLVFERPTVCSARVREGIVFSDGTPMTAQHVASSLSRIKDLRERATVDTRGDRVVFTLKSPNPHFHFFLLMNFCGVALEKGGQLLGTGPYVQAGGDRNATLRLTRNPLYREKVPIEEVQFTVYTPAADGSPTGLVDAIRKGQVDFTTGLTAMAASDLQKQQVEIVAWTTTGNSTGILYFQTERPALRDPRVRRAIAHAIDRHEIARLSFVNFMTFSAENVLPPMMQASSKGARDGILNDTHTAQELLSQTGVSAPKELSLLLPWSPRPYMPNPRQAGDIIARQLGRIGIRVNLQQTETNADFFGRADRGDFDLLLLGWIADSPDPADFLESLLSSANIPQQSVSSSTSSNRSRWRDAGMDTLLGKYRATADADTLAAILRIVRDEVPLFPLIYGPSVTVLSKRVRNFRPSPLGRVMFSKLSLKST